MSITNISISVMSFIVIFAIILGFESNLQSKIIGSQPHLVITTKSGNSITNHENIILKLKDIPNIKSITPCINIQAILSTEKTCTCIMLKGSKKIINNLKTIDLKNLKNNIQNSIKNLPPIIISSKLSSTLEIIHGSQIYITSLEGITSHMGNIPRTKKFHVSTFSKPEMLKLDLTTAYIPIKEAKLLLQKTNSITSIEIKLKNVSFTERSTSEISMKLGKFFLIKNWKQINNNLFSTLKLEKISMSIIILFALILSILSINASLTIIIHNKKIDIFVLKILGTTNKEIKLIFILIGITIGIIGTSIGVFVGILICKYLQTYSINNLPIKIYQITTIPIYLNLYHITFIFFFAILSCALASIWPIKEALNKNINISTIQR